MTDFKLTIGIADFGQPHLMDAAVRGLIKHSVHKHKILVITSDPDVDTRPGMVDARARDWEVDTTAPRGFRRRLTSTKQWAELNKDWLASHEVEVREVSSAVNAFKASYQRGEVYPGATDYGGGVDTAFKDNLGVEWASTEWVLPCWDGDMFPSPGWDEPVVKLMGRLASNEVIVPVHVQPHPIPAWGPEVDPWVEGRKIANGVIAMPTARRVEGFGGTPWVTEQEWIDFCARMRRSSLLREPCGARTLCHWNPFVCRKEQFDLIGRYNYKGSGYDMDPGNEWGKRGWYTVTPQDSFVLHKGFPPVSL